MDSERETGGGRIAQVAGRVARLAEACGVQLGVAESCTGGRVAAALTAMSGSSTFFVGGVVSYANRAKTELLGVSEGLLAAHGAVSEEVACAMATGVRARLGVDLAVATTGIAGPTGGTPGKPVGTVWLALASTTGTRGTCHAFEGNRSQIQEQATRVALELLAGAMETD